MYVCLYIDTFYLSDDDTFPTSHYNSFILQDLTALDNLEMIKTYLKKAPGVQKGIALLKTWLHQRELDIVSE